MEITGKVLREVEFRDRLRGYDTDEVDEFLERVATAVDEMNAEHQSLRARAEAAERQLQTMPPLDDEAIRRTLVLAQRTADLAVREARSEAEQVLSEAHSRADAVLAEAEEESARLRAETDRHVTERTADLSNQHDRLTREIRILSALLESERTRIRQSLSEALRFVSESLGASDEVTAAVGSATEPLGTGEDEARSGGQPGSSDPLDPGQPSGETALAGAPLGAERSPSSAPVPFPPSEGTPPLHAAPPLATLSSESATGPAAAPDPSAPFETPPIADPGGSASASSLGTASQSSPAPGPGPDAGPGLGAGASAGADGAPTRPARAEARSSAPTSGDFGGPRRVRANGSASRAERDIEAELMEDAGLSGGHRALWDEPPPGPTSRPTPVVQGMPADPADPVDDDALWARWAAGGTTQLEPLVEPPPTQAYRIESDGSWTA